MLHAQPVPAFSDNYLWLLDNGGDAAFVVDPGDARPVQQALDARGLKLAGILVTHHHPDHVGGVDALRKAAGGIPVYGPRASPATCITHRLDDGARLEVLGHSASVLRVPG